MSRFAWGTVTDVSPLRVMLDGDTVELPFALDSLIDPADLASDDRVRCELTGRRIVILGRSGGVDLSPITEGEILDVTLTIGTETQAVRFHKVGKRVFGEGEVGSGNGLTLSGTLQVIYTLPAGWRPASIETFVVGGGGNTLNRVVVRNTGTVEVARVVGSGAGAFLDPVSFRTA